MNIKTQIFGWLLIFSSIAAACSGGAVRDEKRNTDRSAVKANTENSIASETSGTSETTSAAKTPPKQNAVVPPPILTVFSAADEAQDRSCKTDADCPEDQECAVLKNSKGEEKRMCRVKDSCDVDDDCTAPQVCAFKQCRDLCHDKRDCPPGWRCQVADRPFSVCLKPDPDR